MNSTPRKLIYDGLFNLIENKPLESGYKCRTSAFLRTQIINYILYNIFDIVDLKMDALQDPNLDIPIKSRDEIDELGKVTNEILKAIICISMKCEPKKYRWECNLKHGSPLKAPEFAKHQIMHHHVVLRPEISKLINTSKKFVTGDWILYKINEVTKEIYIIGLFIHPDNIIRYNKLHNAWLNKIDIQSIIDELDNTFNSQEPEKIKIANQISTQHLNSINADLVDIIMHQENWV